MEKSGIVFKITKGNEVKEIKALQDERDELKEVGQLTVEVDFCDLRESRPEKKIRKLEQETSNPA